MSPQTNGKSSEQAGEASKRRSRSPNRTYPTIDFAGAIALAKGIRQYASGDQIRRSTLLQKLNRSPDSSATRDLIASSLRYGLTEGSYAAEFLTLTDGGKIIVDADRSPAEVRSLAFQMAIARIDVFGQLYEILKNKRVPDADILRDDVAQIGVAEADRSRVGDIFLKNLRYAGLIREVSGSERIVPIEQVLEEMDPPSNGKVSQPPPGVEVSASTMHTSAQDEGLHSQSIEVPGTKTPSVHIDIQIHIDSSASPEQIDQIFASMARHLYSRRDS